ncbi:ABC transporter permease [Kineosporia sp. A_224]|uniref:ABC transporter permease n=1 Tax=Kineosporia sp. A_224 TaxID=1962180 RepID=UPI001179F20E|nr:ABC transporter permease [Kineosporia sp. A_224]
MTDVDVRVEADQPPAVGRHHAQRRPSVSFVAVLAWVAVLVVAPNMLLLFYSVLTNRSGRATTQLTLDNYVSVVTSDVTPLLLGRTLVTAVAAAALATVIAYPAALFALRNLGRHRTLAVLLMVVPLWISYLVRVYAWKIILGDSGVINSTLAAVGLTDEPLSFLLYSRFAVLITLTYVSIPFVFVTSYTALERIPPSLLEAAEDSGASPFRVVRHVIWPLSRQSAAIGFSLALLIAVGDYLTPSLVGGLRGTMYGSLVVSQFGIANNWPLGAALSVVLMVVVGALLLAVARLTRTEGHLE